MSSDVLRGAVKAHLFNVDKTIVQLQKVVAHSTVLRCVLQVEKLIVNGIFPG